MAEIIRMPRLSDTMEEGTVEAWHKKVGDTVSEGDILAEIQTDKAVQEFESEFDGTLLHIGVRQGETTAVDAILAIIGDANEDISGILAAENGSAPSNSPAPETTPAPATTEAATADTSFTMPEGVKVVTMPRLSDTMEEGTVVKWHKQTGDSVSEGDLLADIETDKAVQEFETEYDGTLLYQGAKEGDAAPVDTILAIIGPAGTDVSAVVANYGKEATAPAAEPKATPSTETPKTETTPAASSTQNTATGGRIFASPLAKKLAEEKGYDLSQISGSGENGRIIKRDVENHTPSAAASAVATTASTSSVAQVYVPGGEDQVIPHAQMRKVIAKRLSESKFTAPHYYLTIEVNMDETMASRKKINEVSDTKISFNDFVLKSVAMALRKHPQINSTWKDNEMIFHGNINLGVAVAVEDGLVVPVVKNTDFKSLAQISTEVKDLATRSRDKKIKADEMEGSTFTVSNLGAYGIESFTSIINQPNSCILSVGAIVQKPVVKNGQIVVGNTMKLTLACDHRTVDGATGSLFLQTLKTYLENPVSML